MVLAVLSVYDIKFRELPPKLVASSLLLLGLLRLIEGFSLDKRILAVYIIFDILILLIISVIAYMKLLGWGDVAAIAIICVSAPTPVPPSKILPPPLLTLVYYVIIVTVLMAANLIINIIKYRKYLSKLPPKYRLLYLIMARPRKAIDIIRNPGWWYPLNLCGKYSLSFDIYLDPPDISRKVRQAIESGCLKRDDIVWVTYGLPGVPIITIAYVIALLIGDSIFY
jgi:preflagellin peptidase FlaK